MQPYGDGRRVRRKSTAPVEGASPALLGLYFVATAAALIKGLVQIYQIPENMRREGAVTDLTVGLLSNAALFFLIVIPVTLLGIYIALQILNYEMPDGPYLKAGGVAALPGVLLVFIVLLPPNPVLLVLMFLALIPLTVYVLYFTFGLDLPGTIVSWVFGAGGYIGGQLLAKLLVGLILAGMTMGRDGSSSANQSSAYRRSTPERSYSPPPPAPVEPVSVEDRAITELRRRVIEMTNRKLDYERRETLLVEFASIQKESAELKSRLGNDPVLAEVTALIPDLEKKIMAVPSQRPDPAIYVDMAAAHIWRLGVEQKALLDEEISFGAHKLSPLKQARLDLRSSERDRRGLVWTLADHRNAHISLSYIPRKNPRQKRPWLITRAFQIESAQADDLLAVYRPNGVSSVGMVNSIPFMRIADQASASEVRERFVQYLTLDGDRWLAITIECPAADAQAAESLEIMARTIRRSAPNEQPADPFAPHRVAARLMDSFEEAAVILKAHGPAAEACLIECLSSTDEIMRMRAAQVLGDVGGEKSVEALRAMLSGSGRDVPAVKAALRKLAPLEFDEVAEAIAILEGEDNFSIRQALAVLAKASADDRREKVAAALEGLLDSGNPVIYERELAGALKVWATNRTLVKLLPLLEENSFASARHLAMDVFAELKDPRSVYPIVQWILLDTRAASSALSKMGPVAEPEVLKLLGNPNPIARRAAASILEAVGTVKSVRPLMAATQDRDMIVAETAKISLAAVRERLAAATQPSTQPTEQPRP